ncbi:hypothetical protein ACFL2V_02460 [Pseudomonadota bacterium]
MIADDVAQNRLTICLPDWQCALHENGSGEVYAVYRQSHHPKPSIRAFLDFLVEKTKSK